MQIRILGCNGGVGPGLLTTCVCINGQILVDAGTGVGSLELAQMWALSDVFLTHSHLDHVCGLAFLADNRIGRAETSLRVRAPAATVLALRTHLFNGVLWADFERLPSAERPTLRLEALEAGQAVAVGGLNFTAFPSPHTVPAVGYAVADAGGCFAFTGDTYAGAQMWAALNALPRLDQLMIEVAYPDLLADVGEAARHLTPARLGRELAQLRHRPEILVTHAKPGYEGRIREECRESLRGWRYRHLYNGACFEC